ncbi:hypothetical protein J4437_04425 [Candidatus Woesearchaeota archaeon]|nr:hypothetical protein [Candidatus Woesearchaeota archaeon]
MGKKVLKNALKQKVPKKKVSVSKWHAVPLKGSFMLASMLGFLISLYSVYPNNKSFGFAFMLIFAAMFAASIVSLSKSPVIVP